MKKCKNKKFNKKKTCYLALLLKGTCVHNQSTIFNSPSPGPQAPEKQEREMYEVKKLINYNTHIIIKKCENYFKKINYIYHLYSSI